jgi:hypothetical protein
MALSLIDLRAIISLETYSIRTSSPVISSLSLTAFKSEDLSLVEDEFRDPPIVLDDGSESSTLDGVSSVVVFPVEGAG